MSDHDNEQQAFWEVVAEWERQDSQLLDHEKELAKFIWKKARAAINTRDYSVGNIPLSGSLLTDKLTHHYVGDAAAVKPPQNTAPLNGGTCSPSGLRPSGCDHGFTEVGEQNNCDGGVPKAGGAAIRKDVERKRNPSPASTGNTEERELDVIYEKCRGDIRPMLPLMSPIFSESPLSEEKEGADPTSLQIHLDALRNANAGSAITVLKDGSYKHWQTLDAKYYEGEEDWLCTIPLPHIAV